MPTPRHRAATKAKPVGIPITHVAEHLGISTHVLRIWEHRYAWPKPERHPNGYRHYPQALVTILERVRDELQRGKVIGDLMRDPWWQQVFDTGRFPESPTRTRGEPPWDYLPTPVSAHGRDVKTRLQQALVAGDPRLARGAMAMGERLRPEERECAVKAVLRMWHQHQS